MCNHSWSGDSTNARGFQRGGGGRWLHIYNPDTNRARSSPVSPPPTNNPPCKMDGRIFQTRPARIRFGYVHAAAQSAGSVSRSRFNVESIERRLLLRACVGVYIVRAHGLSAVSSALQRIHPCCCCCCCNTRAPPSPQSAKHQPQSARKKKTFPISAFQAQTHLSHSRVHSRRGGGGHGDDDARRVFICPPEFISQRNKKKTTGDEADAAIRNFQAQQEG